MEACKETPLVTPTTAAPGSVPAAFGTPPRSRRSDLQDPLYVSFSPSKLALTPQDSCFHDEATEGLSLPTTPLVGCSGTSPKFPPPSTSAPIFKFTKEDSAPAWDGEGCPGNTYETQEKLCFPPGLEAHQGLEHSGSFTFSKRPSKSFAPPALQQPPGLELSDVGNHIGSTIEVAPATIDCFKVGAAVCPKHEDRSADSVHMVQVDVDGVACARVEWHIADLRKKLKSSLDRPLVSPTISMVGLSDLKLMVIATVKDPTLRGKTKASHFAKMIKDGPLHCKLEVKVPSAIPVASTFYLTIGARSHYYCGVGELQRQGPFLSNFAEKPTHTCDNFDCNCLALVDKGGGLTVGLEIVSEATTSDSLPVP